MNLSRRYLRLAFTFLALMILTFLTAVILDLSTHARINAVATAAAKKAPVNASPEAYEAFLEGLPRPSGWISYSIDELDPTRPWLRLSEKATVSNPAWDAPFVRFLDQYGVLDTSGGGISFIAADNTRYQLSFLRLMPGPLVFLGIVGLWAAFWVMLALWLYQDAKARLGRQALPWLALGLVGGPIAIAIWLIQRPSPPPPPPVCPACKIEQVADATYCVACGSHLKPTCAECGRAIELGWKHCPTCGNHLGQETA